MNSSVVLVVFIIEFFILAGLALAEKNYPQALYGLGGAILNIGVLCMAGK
jgi:hypothetical protein